MGTAMQRIARTVIAVLLGLATAAPAAHAAFGVSSFSADMRDSADNPVAQAGATPYTAVTEFTFNNFLGAPDGHVKAVRVDLPPGVTSNPESTPKCTDSDFPSCPADTQVGTDTVTAFLLLAPHTFTVPVYNMVPKPEQVSDFAFNLPLFGRTDIVGGIRNGSDYGSFFTISDIPQAGKILPPRLPFFRHPAAQNGGGGAPSAFIRLPTTCDGPGTTKLTVISHAGETATATSTSPSGATGCDQLPFDPSLAVAP